MTLIATAVGNLGKDAEYKTTQGGTEMCSFSVATTSGYGDNKQTLWVDVTKWGKGAEGLSKLLVKGTKVTAIGELSTREHNGKTYVQMRADHVILQGGRNAERPTNTAAEYGYSQSQKPAPVTDPLDDDLSDSVPF
jgi:single-strand DNA-binding protein